MNIYEAIDNLSDKDKDNIYLIPHMYIRSLDRNRWLNPVEFLSDYNDIGEYNRVDDTNEKFSTPQTIAHVWIKEIDNNKIYVIICTKICMAHRPRGDGLIGLQSISGNDTRLGFSGYDAKLYKKMNSFLKKSIKRTSKDSADWSKKDSKFSLLKEK